MSYNPEAVNTFKQILQYCLAEVDKSILGERNPVLCAMSLLVAEGQPENAIRGLTVDSIVQGLERAGMPKFDSDFGRHKHNLVWNSATGHRQKLTHNHAITCSLLAFATSTTPAPPPSSDTFQLETAHINHSKERKRKEMGSAETSCKNSSRRHQVVDQKD